MPNRRDILKQTCALGVTVTAHAVQAARDPATSAPPGTTGPHIRSVVRRDETILRLGGLGDGYDMTWDAHDRQYVVVNDGTGWVDKPTAFYNTRLWTLNDRIQDGAQAAVSGYPELNDSTRPQNAPHYYGHGLVAVRGRLYQFLSTLDRATDRPLHWVGAKLIYSVDGGRTWCNQDGTSPVVWEDWTAQSRRRLAFFQEPDESFSLLSIVQMGRDYSANRDGYIYVYGLNGNVDGRMNELVLLRVPIGELPNRGAYEYFGGRSGHGRARWVKNIEARAIVHSFPRGWVNRANLFPGDLVVESWLPSVVYNEPLGLYLMASAGIGVAPDGTEFGKPSYLGFWVSSTPWGPWNQIHEETAWTPAGDLAARAYGPRIAPRWIAADGKSFWLVWPDLKGILTFAADEPIMTAALEKAGSPEQRATVQSDFTRRYMPRYAFNAQRVDLIVR
jgi:uncharacterized protein DUF4185